MKNCFRIFTVALAAIAMWACADQQVNPPDVSSVDPVRTLDLSNNHDLQDLDLRGLPHLSAIQVASDAPFRQVLIDGLPLTTAQLDDLIDDIYAGAVFHDVHHGYFQHNNLPAALTPASMDQLRSLQNYFGWTIQPAVH